MRECQQTFQVHRELSQLIGGEEDVEQFPLLSVQIEVELLGDLLAVSGVVERRGGEERFDVSAGSRRADAEVEAESLRRSDELESRRGC